MLQVVDSSLPYTYNFRLVKHSNQAFKMLLLLNRGDVCEFNLLHVIRRVVYLWHIKSLFNNVDLHEPHAILQYLK